MAKRVRDGFYKPKKRMGVIRKGATTIHEELGVVKPVYYHKISRDHDDLMALSDELLEWCYSSDRHVNIYAFPVMKRMNPYKFFKVNNEEFQDKVTLAKYIVWLNRERAASEGDIHFSELKRTAYWYDKLYREDEHERYAMLQKSQSTALAASQFQVYLEPIDTGLPKLEPNDE